MQTAPKSTSWPKTAVMGSGAVGCYYGGMLARAGAEVTLIGRPQHVEAINREGGLAFEGLHFSERIALTASTDATAIRGAKWVLFSVKSIDTDEAAAVIAPHLEADAVIIGLQNGVDNIDRIRRHLP